MKEVILCPSLNKILWFLFVWLFFVFCFIFNFTIHHCLVRPVFYFMLGELIISPGHLWCGIILSWYHRGWESQLSVINDFTRIKKFILRYTVLWSYNGAWYIICILCLAFILHMQYFPLRVDLFGHKPRTHLEMLTYN